MENIFFPNSSKISLFISRDKVHQLETRCEESKFAIEKCYLCYELARLHLKKLNFEGFEQMIVLVVSEARRCRNNVWLILGLHMVLQYEIYHEESPKFVEAYQEFKETLLRSNFPKWFGQYFTYLDRVSILF